MSCLVAIAVAMAGTMAVTMAGTMAVTMIMEKTETEEVAKETNAPNQTNKFRVGDWLGVDNPGDSLEKDGQRKR